MGTNLEPAEFLPHVLGQWVQDLLQDNTIHQYLGHIAKHFSGDGQSTGKHGRRPD